MVKRKPVIPTWFLVMGTCAILVVMLVYGFLAYSRDEWMMWK